ncbi:G-type lectin S-receptor-like serine/threonine-protein kinase SD2-5 isoform X2 [Hevea brasiliensis]|uniref:G-type lectin S-receptor-like serine/threonine-protein kinase SD2-5 isoform X2 n=1 Tax=Hevea brasiliensis TaxID=3981 RepID=UPI0025FB6F75|nr:G-type lectin S-receptor-like serine/threonine-protein kinase SD2-5 isoform X2 [Hevea brasiliensis]
MCLILLWRVALAFPVEYSVGFIGRAFLMETNQMEPNFKAALSVEPIDGKYSCSLEVFLGDVKVWNSGHYSPFFTSERCVLELTKQGDLQLKGEKERVGWRTGTSGQGVEILKILGTGNLVLVDALNLTKWQSFNFPTDVMLRGQRLNVATRLTSFPTNSTAFYSLEIQYNKIALYLNSGRWNYSYWEFKPSKNRNITFAELGSKGLALFNDNHHKMAKISLSKRIHHPLGFLALGNKTGNLGLYFYSPDKQRFEAAFQALNTTCDLPLSCKPYGICTFYGTCSCIQFLTNEKGMGSDCSDGFSGGFCGRGEVEMRELYGVSSVLRAAPTKLNISKVACAKFCLQNCKCVAALYSSEELRECHLYGVVMGVKQVERGTRWTYMVKVQKGSHVGHENSGLKKWVLAMVGLIDSLVILLVFGGFAYYLIRKRRNNTATTADNTT